MARLKFKILKNNYKDIIDNEYHSFRDVPSCWHIAITNVLLVGRYREILSLQCSIINRFRNEFRYYFSV